ncbi:MAG: UDP-N-acetylmuramoyl-L-alanyl-D-glutamate--2,6-diaminopimelate ligase [Actinomycetota bacterium]
MPSTESPRPAQSPHRTMTELAALLGASVISADETARKIAGITHDSRAIRPGDLYAALPGAHAHGADFALAAAGHGAAAMLTDRPGPHPLPTIVVEKPREVLGRVASWVYDDPSRAMDVIGITGTNGKTTTAYLIEAGLRGAGRSTGLIGTVETRIGAESLSSVHTTPEAPDLQALLALMRERGVQSVPMEVSSHGLALGRVDGTVYTAAVFTNLSQDHLDFHADMDDYFRAKAKLFDIKRSRVAVINVDDEAGERLLHLTRLPVTTTSARGRSLADWRATEIVQDSAGSSFRLHGPAGEDVPIRLRMTGAYNVANALSALAALASIGVDLEAAAAGMAGLAGVPGRLESIDAGQDFGAFVDFAHSPDSLANVLQTLRPVTPGRLIVVLGCGGDRDRGKRPLMGTVATTYADLAIVTSDNPRSEDPSSIIAAIVEGAVEGAELEVEPDRRAAIDRAVALAAAGDTVLLAGKGHEPQQEFADHVIDFDDRIELRRAIETAAR